MNVPHADGRPPAPYWFALTRVTDDANLVESLRRVAVAGCELLTNCASASVTVIAAGRPVTMAASDGVATSRQPSTPGRRAVPDRGTSGARLPHRGLAAHERWPVFRGSAFAMVCPARCRCRS